MRRSARISVLAGHPRWIFFGRLAVLNLATQLCAFSAILTNRRVRRYEPGGTHCRRTVEKCEKSTAFHSITSSAGRCDRALWLSLGPEANGLDWNATAVGQNSTIALRLHPVSSFGGGFAVLVNNPRGVAGGRRSPSGTNRRWALGRRRMILLVLIEDRFKGFLWPKFRRADFFQAGSVPIQSRARHGLAGLHRLGDGVDIV